MAYLSTTLESDGFVLGSAREGKDTKSVGGFVFVSGEHIVQAFCCGKYIYTMRTRSCKRTSVAQFVQEPFAAEEM